MHKLIKFLLVSLILLGVISVNNVSASNVIYVKYVANIGEGSGSLENPYTSLSNAISKAKDGDRIIIISNAYLNENDGSNENSDGALVIDKALTIESSDSATISLRLKGIIITKDVTFKNIVFSLANTYRNAIFANGHSLTLINCKQDSSVKTKLNIYGGNFNSSKLPLGSSSNITISDSLIDGRIFTGSMGLNNDLKCNVTINNVTTSDKKNIEGVFDGNSDVPLTDLSLDPNYQAPKPLLDVNYLRNANSSISLNNTKLSLIDSTHNQAETSVSLVSDSPYVVDNITLKNIDNLSILKGEFKPNLDNSLNNLKVEENGKLQLFNFPSNLKLCNVLDGSGTLMINPDFKILVDKLSENCNIKINFPISKYPIIGNIYLQFEEETNGNVSFGNQPNGNSYDQKLIKDGNTYWVFKEEEIFIEYEVDEEQYEQGYGLVELTDKSEEAIDYVFERFTLPSTPIGVNAIANNGYQFIGWYTDVNTKEIVETANPLVPSKVNGKYIEHYYAYFKAITNNKYSVNISVNDDSLGSVSQTSINDVLENSVIIIDKNKLLCGNIEIIAKSKESDDNYTYSFKAWSIDGKEVNENIIVDKALKIEAIFEKQAKIIFNDVDSKTSHQNAINWLASEGISTGWLLDDGTRDFRPYANITRADMAAFLYRYAKNKNIVLANKSDAQPFIDVDTKVFPVNGDHYKGMLWMKQTGISTGWTCEKGAEFKPYANLTRADMAAFLFRLQEISKDSVDLENIIFDDVLKNEWQNKDQSYQDHLYGMVWMANQEISKGWYDEKTKVSSFKPYSTLARADMAAFLERLSKLQ